MWRGDQPPPTGTGVMRSPVAVRAYGGSVAASTPRTCSLALRVRCVSESEDSSSSALVDSAFVAACRNTDDNRIRQLMTCRALTPQMVNCSDRTGKTGVSYICISGNIALLELITPIPSLDVNVGDNEGNTPLHFASQAGHVDVVHHLINRFKDLQVDQRNQFGFTPLMKAALQGRTKCVKLLLATGASPILRDHGRGLCPREWARFCGRHACAEVIEKFAKSASCGGSFALQAQLRADSERWTSEPNLQFLSGGGGGGLRQRLKRAFKPASDSASVKKPDYSLVANLSNVAVFASSPLIPTASVKKGTALTSGNCCGPGSTLCLTPPEVQVTEAVPPQ